jgi:hypothetical protein
MSLGICLHVWDLYVSNVSHLSQQPTLAQLFTIWPKWELAPNLCTPLGSFASNNTRELITSLAQFSFHFAFSKLIIILLSQTSKGYLAFSIVHFVNKFFPHFTMVKPKSENGLKNPPPLPLELDEIKESSQKTLTFKLCCVPTEADSTKIAKVVAILDGSEGICTAITFRLDLDTVLTGLHILDGPVQHSIINQLTTGQANATYNTGSAVFVGNERERLKALARANALAADANAPEVDLLAAEAAVPVPAITNHMAWPITPDS